MGAEPIEYGPGLPDRVRALAPGGVTAASDLFGTETAEAALALGIPPARISTIAAGPNPPGGVRATGGAEADLGDMQQITDAILAGKITVPIAATFPIEQTRDAATLQAQRHVHGKIAITLRPRRPPPAAPCAESAKHQHLRGGGTCHVAPPGLSHRGCRSRRPSVVEDQSGQSAADL